MRNFSLFAVLLGIGLLFCSCSDDKASVNGRIDPVPVSARLFVEVPDGKAMKVVDSVKLSSDGSFKFSVKLKEAQPEFYYIYKDDVKLASLVLKAGDMVTLQCDTLGGWTVEGSEDCSLLREREVEAAKAARNTSDFTMKDYIAFYRNSLRFVMAHPKSMVVVPVLFQTLGETPVFAQLTDGVIFQMAADSLATIYPDSRYVSILRSEAKSRIDRLNLQMKLEKAQERSFPELDFPDISGKDVKLSSVLDNFALVVFWDATLPTCRIFNQDVLFPLYEKYSGKGLQIYQVNIGTAKTQWASTVRSQGLPWVNVCDTKGKSIAQYGISAVPTMFLVSEDSLIPVTAADVDARVNALLQ